VILAGDIGGTNARLALFSLDGARTIDRATYESRKYPGLEPIVREFLASRRVSIRAACFGVAGPVVGGRCVATNLPWIIDAKRLARVLKLPSVELLNDLVALAFGAVRAPASKIVSLSGGSRPRRTGANVAVIAAGTGLGEAALVWDGEKHVPVATEGSHVDFAARNELEWELRAYAEKRVGSHVSYERFVSGPGLGLLYDFFRQARGVGENRRAEDAIRRAADKNAEITHLGMSGESVPAGRALDLFASLYGAEAGNLALKTMATGGVFVAGNIAGHVFDKLAGGAFMKSFVDKGRFRGLLEKTPVAVVRGTELGLAGSAAFAARSLGKT
jgi:glucokinase